jgi:flagellar hook-associated protein 2
VDYSRISGLATGLDTESMVNALMQAERIPLDRLLQEKQIWEWKQEDYRTVNSALSELRNKLFSAKLQSTYLVKKTTSTNTAVVTATATPTASVGTYYITVTQLARPATAYSSDPIVSNVDDFDPNKPLASYWTNLANTSIEFEINGRPFTVDPDTISLNQVIAQVNADKAAGVTMAYDAQSGKLFLSTTATGSDAKITLQDVSGTFLKDTLKLPTTTTLTGQDAALTINDVFSTNSHTNSYTINGTTFHFSSVGNATVTVGYDVDAIVSAVKGMVDAYNSALKTMTDLYYQKRNRDYPPLTDEQRKALTQDQIEKWEKLARSGMLSNDPTLDNVISTLRSIASSIVEGLPTSVIDGKEVTLNSLSAIGINTENWWDRGQLKVDESKLRRAIEADPEAVMRLFTNPNATGSLTDTSDPNSGLAVRLYNTVNNAIKIITGIAGTSSDIADNSSISQRIRELSSRAADLERRLDEKREQYYRQFTALEQAIAQMNSQSAYLASMLGGGSR